ncbi:unnamed protein product [Blepharisma stoltei]|uniref:TPX2 central domain-containing protein n=1 Tax=Blepharisma stoltei TaxID=1481888 RepID=A0AAU9IWH1_9CILI|nr:unnamed protein product [Blepharisma stoltei]
MFKLDIASRRIIFIPKQPNTRASISSSSTEQSNTNRNIEYERNDAVDQKKRDEIESKFQKSSQKACYMFPRYKPKPFQKLPVIQLKSRRTESKNYEEVKSLCTIKNSSKVNFFERKPLSKSPISLARKELAKSELKTKISQNSSYINIAPIETFHKNDLNYYNLYKKNRINRQNSDHKSFSKLSEVDELNTSQITTKSNL